MNNYSLTIAGILTLVLSSIAKSVNHDFPVSEQELANTVTTIVQILGLLMTYIGRVRHGDITLWGAKK